MRCGVHSGEYIESEWECVYTRCLYIVRERLATVGDVVLPAMCDCGGGDVMRIEDPLERHSREEWAAETGEVIVAIY